MLNYQKDIFFQQSAQIILNVIRLGIFQQSSQIKMSNDKKKKYFPQLAQILFWNYQKIYFSTISTN